MNEEKPSIACLLRLARAALAGELGPRSLDERREDLALTERIVAIAERELNARDMPGEGRALLLAFYDGMPAETAWRRLAEEIRTGVFDAPGARREEVRRLLWAATAEKLRVSNPGFLAWEDPS